MPLTAVRHVRKMRGGAQSHLLEADDGRWYVVKFRNNPQHRRILVNELLSGAFLDYLKITAPETALIEVTAPFLQANPDVHLSLGSRRIAVEPGWHFGSRYPGDPARMAVYDFLPDALLPQVVNLDEFRAILVFDKWVANADGRQSVFYRAMVRRGAAGRPGFVARMIDHGFAFNGPNWDFPDSPVQGLYARRLVYGSRVEEHSAGLGGGRGRCHRATAGRIVQTPPASGRIHRSLPTQPRQSLPQLEVATIGFVLHRFVLHNGSIQQASDLSLAPGQVGLLSGWGVFSTLRVSDGVLFAFERHWARISRDAAAFHVAIPSDPENVRRKLLELVEANGAYNSTLRLVIVRNGGGMWAGPSNGRESDLIALTADSKDWGSGVKLAYQANGRHATCPFAGTKILSWAMNLTWLETAQRRGFDEVILLNERGEAAECTSANIFVANGNQVSTPPLSSGCLPGITREVLLCEIHVPGYTIAEKPLAPAEIESADEVFITSTTRDLLPVREIEGRKVGRSDHARVALSAAFRDYLHRYVSEHRGQPAAR
jgi:branched-chain amino acid aminotransferase